MFWGYHHLTKHPNSPQLLLHLCGPVWSTLHQRRWCTTASAWSRYCYLTLDIRSAFADVPKTSRWLNTTQVVWGFQKKQYQDSYWTTRISWKVAGRVFCRGCGCMVRGFFSHHWKASLKLMFSPTCGHVSRLAKGGNNYRKSWWWTYRRRTFPLYNLYGMHVFL